MNGWEIIRTVDSEHEAHLLAGALRSVGIEALIDSRLFRQEPVGFGLLGGARIMVPSDQAEAAARHLAELDESELDADLVEAAASDEGEGLVSESAEVEAAKEGEGSTSE